MILLTGNSFQHASLQEKIVPDGKQKQRNDTCLMEGPTPRGLFYSRGSPLGWGPCLALGNQTKPTFLFFYISSLPPSLLFLLKLRGKEERDGYYKLELLPQSAAANSKPWFKPFFAFKAKSSTCMVCN